MDRHLGLACFLTLAGLMGCSASSAQESRSAAPVTLAVKDPTGAEIPSAQVEIYALPTRAVLHRLTDSQGLLSLELAPGSYEVIVKMQGFGTEKRQLDVQNDAPQNIEVDLKIGSYSGPMVSDFVLVGFPAQSHYPSPDGRYVLVGVDSDTAPHHTVFLDDTRTKTRRKLFSYPRHVSLVWNYPGTTFAVTDYEGSDSARCRIYSVDESKPTIECLDQLLQQLSDDARNTLKRRMRDHFYVEALLWVKPMTLYLRIWGYGEQDLSGFSEYYDLHAHFDSPANSKTSIP